MSHFTKSYDLIRPLSIGNVVSIGLFLYRTHLKSYFFLALKANFWLMLPIATIFFVWTLGTKFASTQASILWILLVIITSIITLTYGWAKFSTASALISRLVFNELIEHSETIKDAQKKVNARIWAFLVTNILVTLILLVFIIVLIIGFFLIWLIIILSIERSKIYQNDISIIHNKNVLMAIALFFLLLIIVTSMAFFAGVTWVYSRFLITEVSLAIESNVSPGKAIGYNWELTKKSIVRIQGVIIITFLITLPIHLPIQILGAVLQNSNSFFSRLLYTLIIMGLGLLSGALLVPFWQAVKAVVYYDLRIRQEGLGMQQHLSKALNQEVNKI